MPATSSTLLVRVNTGVTENAGMEMRDSRKMTLENPKPIYRIQRLTKTYDTYFRSLLA